MEDTGIIESIEENMKNITTAASEGRLQQLLEEMMPGIVGFLLNIVFAFILLFVGRKLIQFILKLLNRSFDKAKTDASLRGFLNSLLRVIMYSVLIMILADQVGIPTTSFLAVLGSAGLAIGMALQGSLANFAGGVLILMLKPFKVGDYIVEDSKGNGGTVENIDLFYTHLVTPDNRRIVIPNGSLANTSLTNVSALETRRLDLTVGISYSADLKKAKELLYQILLEREKVLEEKEITVFVDSLGDSSVNLGFRAWVRSGDYWSERWAILEEVKSRFDEHSIEIPFQQLDVHMRGNTGSN